MPPRIAAQKKSCRYFSPHRHHAVHQLGGLPTKRRVDTNRNQDLVLKSVDFGRGGARDLRQKARSVRSGPVRIDPIASQDVIEVKPVDGTKAKKLVETGDGFLVLDLRQSSR